ncbi:GTP-binding protein [Saccharomonospora piscinae]|uniref:GTP-binding protein n=1 Tax=Saccharomonospora piscinae TaxID=687388 RepID=UPI000465A34E|nr:ATP/GTP-binding protein [Saccharomonospora piscinae]
MDSATSEAAEAAAPSAARPPLRSTATDGVKIVVVGGFGVGKSTLVRSVSEIRPLSTEETMTEAGRGVDQAAGVGGKSSTTVAFDFGRVSLTAELVLYLFGAPGQQRFWFLWERLFAGTLGAVVLLDTRRVEDSWYAIDRLEQHGMPFVVAHNVFPGAAHDLGEVRDSLSLSGSVPVVACDARRRESAKQVLLTLVRHLHTMSRARGAHR